MQTRQPPLNMLSSAVRDDFPLLRSGFGGRPLVYLDSAATSLKPQAVIDAVTRFYTVATASVHRGVHGLSDVVTEAFETSRELIAQFIGAAADEIVITHGATSAINLVRASWPDLKSTAAIGWDHHSNLLPWAYPPAGRMVSFTREGELDWSALDQVLSEQPQLLAVTHVSNVLGTESPLDEIIRRAHAAGTLVLVDASQSAPHLPLDVYELDADFLVFSSHKMLGPSGVGVLYAKRDHLARLQPWQLGGQMVDEVHFDGFTVRSGPRRLEAGTPPIEGVLGLAAAMQYLRELRSPDAAGMEAVALHDQELVSYLVERLRQVPRLEFVQPAPQGKRVGLVSFLIEGLPSHAVSRMLSQRFNIMVRSGYHCAQPLHESLKLPPTLRASLHVYNTLDEIDYLVESLQAIVKIM